LIFDFKSSYEPVEKREKCKEKLTKTKKKKNQNCKFKALQKPETQFANSLIEEKTYLTEIEKLKVEIETLVNEKLELEKTMDDLKCQLKQSEKESQVKEESV